MARRTKPLKADPLPKPERFFELELKNEEAPSLTTMESLYVLAAELFDRQPWDLIASSDLIVVEIAPKELGFCSIMGELGEVFALQVFLGDEGYRLFQRIQKHDALSAGEFLAMNRGVMVEFVRKSELEAPDRQFLKAMGHPSGKGMVAPKFRTSRPGYHPWYVTESEASLLAECIRAVMAMLNVMKEHEEVEFWIKEDRYPLVTLEPNGQKYHVRMVDIPESPLPMPKMPVLDESRIQKIRRHHFPSKGAIQIDHFYSVVPIGEAKARKSCMRMAIAIDAETGFAYAPEVVSAESLTGDVLTNVLLNAIEAVKAVPQEVQVSSREYKMLLTPLADTLGFPVKFSASLPALEFAKNSILEMMGDSGPMEY
jgi:hypothetical protein